MRARLPKKERGSVMIMATCAMVVLLALGLAVGVMTTGEQVSTRAQGDNISLRNVAEAGVDRAFYRLNQDPTWRCENSPAEFTNAAVLDGRGTPLGTFTVGRVADLGGDYLQVTSTAYFPHANAAHPLTRTVRVIAYKQWGTPFSAAAFGKNGVPLANGETDSYNSALGSYHAQAKGSKGDIRTDSADPGSITIFNNGRCRGKVIYGPGTNLSAVTLDVSRIIDGDTNDKNDILAASSTAVMPRVVVPSNAQPISNVTRGANTITNSLVIPAGVYYCDSINITGNDRVWTNGKVILYVKGNMTVGGNGIANNADMVGGVAIPANLIIYGTDTCTSVKIDGNGNLAAAVYAPNADITLNGSGSDGAVYGALAGKTVSFHGNGTVLHYDVALQSLAGVVTGFRSKTWEEG